MDAPVDRVSRPRPSSEQNLAASADELRRLQRVTDAALAHLTFDDLMDELLIRVREALETDTAAILLLDETGTELVARAAKGIEEEVEQRVRIPVGGGFAGTVAATGRPVRILEVDESNVLNDILRQKHVRSLLGVPLVVEGSTLGVLHVGTLTRRAFTDGDIRLLQLVADRVALAIHAGLYERDRAVARTLQRSLLPERLPEVPGMELAGRYLPASGGEVGGDWYDVFLLPDGSVGLAIGDVVGRGVPAAAAMGQIRSAVRAYALGSTPGPVLEAANRYLRSLEPNEMATALFGIVDPVASTFRFANAGHLPPMIRSPQGHIDAPESGAGAPLGVAAISMYDEREVAVPPGSSLILYTDGLVERRGESIDAGLHRLRDAVREPGAPGSVCDRIVSELLSDAEHADDVAVLVVRMAEVTSTLELRFPTESYRLVTMRRTLERWLRHNDVGAQRTFDIIAAVSEAAANAVEHAYGPGGGWVDLAAERRPDGITVRLSDAGRWRPSRGEYRGRGTPMMRAFADHLEVVPGDSGTSVELAWAEPWS